MPNLSGLLKDSAPPALFEFVRPCANSDDLVKKLEGDPTCLFSILQNMKIEGNELLVARLEPMAVRLLYKTSDLENPEVKKVETLLRNRGMLNRTSDPDVVFKEESGAPFMAHKSILALESPYFRSMQGFRETQKNEIEMREFSPEVYKLALEYLYLADEKRKQFLSTVDKTLLPQLSELSFHWKLDELNKQCDDELCNSLGEFKIEKTDMQEWLAQADHFPKFAMLLKFTNRVAGEGELHPIIDQMQTPAGAAQLASKCTPKEIAAFATLKTEFGRACQIPPGTFGALEWEKTFPITIKEVPPLPANIHAILEQEDPCEPGKKLKDTCTLFLRPEQVILHAKDGDKEITLGFDGVEQLAMNATNEKLRTKYATFDALRTQMNQIPAAEAGWVLMRKEVIPGSRNKNFTDQQKLLKGGFEVPKIMDAILLNILIFASEGKCLYGRAPWTYTRCQEKWKDYQTVVGGLAPSGLYVHYHDIDDEDHGLAGCWKF